MTAHTADIHTHTKWGRMVETVLRPIKKLGAAVSGKGNGVRLNELTPQMLVDESPPTVDLTKDEAEGLNELAAHGPSKR